MGGENEPTSAYCLLLHHSNWGDPSRPGNPAGTSPTDPPVLWIEDQWRENLVYDFPVGGLEGGRGQCFTAMEMSMQMSLTELHGMDKMEA